MGPEEFRAAGHELIDWIADYRARIPELPVQAQTKPGEVTGKLPARAPEEAEPFSRLLADLDAIVVPGVTQVQHPRYFGWFPSNATLSSALGDLATAGLGALGITWQSAPALTEVEEVVVERFHLHRQARGAGHVGTRPAVADRFGVRPAAAAQERGRGVLGLRPPFSHRWPPHTRRRP